MNGDLLPWDRRPFRSSDWQEGAASGGRAWLCFLPFPGWGWVEAWVDDMMLDVNMQIWNGDDVVNAGDSTARECCWGVCNMNL